MFCGCGRFRFIVRVIYGTAVFIKSVFKRRFVSPMYCKLTRLCGFFCKLTRFNVTAVNFRFNEHRRTIDNPNNKSKPTTAAEHFLSSPNHTANDMLLIPTEKIFSNRDSIRKAREAFLIQKGKTIDPDGLNIREETY